MLKILTPAIAAALFMVVPALGCDTIQAKQVPLSLCIDSSWIGQTATGDQDYVYYSDDDNVGFMVVSEQGNVAVADFRTAILDNAKKGSDSMDIVGERTEVVADKPWNVLEFKAKTDGSDLDMTNFYYVAPGFGAIQLIYWTTPDLATSAAFRAGKLFSTVKFKN